MGFEAARFWSSWTVRFNPQHFKSYIRAKRRDLPGVEKGVVILLLTMPMTKTRHNLSRMTNRTLTLTWMKVEYDGPTTPSAVEEAKLTTYVNINDEWAEVKCVEGPAKRFLRLFSKFAEEGESRIAEFNSKRSENQVQR